MRVLVDASTAVSGLLFEGNEATLLELGRLRVVSLLVNTYVYEEVARVLRRGEFHLSSREAEELLQYLSGCAAIIENPSEDSIQENYNLLSDKKDLPVAVATLSPSVDYLVTGDRELQEKTPKSVTTRGLLDMLLKKTIEEKGV